MEPKLDLNLHQVTFDEGDLSPSSELDSFSNIVHYDSHFSVVGTTCISTTARSYTPSNTYKEERQPTSVSRSRAVAQPSRVKSSQVYCESVCSSHVNDDLHALINPDDSYVTRKSFSKVIPTDIRTLFQVSANTTSIRKKRVTKLRKPFIMSFPASGISDSPVPDSDGAQAFESVAEALHLQQSVIGDKKITPASPEVVALIVAEAEKKMKEQNQGKEAVPAAVSQVTMSASRPVTTPSASPSYHGNISANSTTSYPPSTTPTNIPNDTPMSQYPSRKDVSGETTPTSPRVGSTPSPASVRSDGSRKEETESGETTPTKLNISSSRSPELIQIPAGSITTVKEKTSWFGGGGRAPLPTPVKEKPMSEGRDSYPLGGEDSGSEVGSGVGDRDESVSSATSELDNLIQSDTDSFLKSLPPVKQVDLSMFASRPHVVRSYSPPVKETSFRPLQTNTAANMTSVTPETDRSSGSPHKSANDLHPTSSFSDSGFPALDMENTQLEFQPSKLLSSTPSKPSLVIPQTGPLFKQLHKMLPKRPAVSAEIKSGDQQLDVVLREKAKLEGQLEMLSEEASATRQERAELHAQLASLKLQLESNRQTASDVQCETLKTELEKIQRSKHLLEQSLGSAHKFLEEKNSDFAIQNEELRMSQETNDKLQIRMKEVRDDVRAKEMTIQALKNKIAELYVEVQTVLQAKMESENDARTARNDLVSLINTKDWYQQQLQAAQVARTTLQHELTTLQAQVTSQGSIIERLRTENAKLRQQTKDIQQKALKDKEMLAKHLEHIESDMMHREAAFQEIHRERVLMEDTFDTKLQSVEQERSRAHTLMHMTSELETHLDKAQGDLKRKQSQILILENEQIDLMKKLALSQECVIERDLAVEELQQKLIEVESSLKAFQSSLREKESEIWKLKEEKAAVEISLQAAREEKQSVDNALASLKDNMGKVEKNFRHMKQELGNRTSEYNEQKRETTALQEELLVVRENLEKEKKGNHVVDREKEEHQMAVDEMRTQKVHLEEEVKFLHSELEALRGSGVEKEKKVECLEAELLGSKQKLSQMEQDLREDVPSPALEELQNENTELKNMHKKSDKQHQKDLTKQKAKVAKLNVDLKSLQSELAQRQSVLESNVELLTGKLREMTVEKEQMETELSMANRKYDLSMLQQQDQLKTELQCLAAELENTKLQKQALENDLMELQRVKELEVQEYSQQLSALEAEITRVQELQVDTEGLERNNQNLSLDLEKERGRVAGLMQTNAALKEHISQLEDALAGRESALVDLQTLTRGEVQDREREEAEHSRLVQDFEKKLTQEKESQRDLRKQIGTKISENKKLKRHLDSVKADRDSVQQDLDHRSKELENLRSELDNSKQLQVVQSSQIGTLDAENKSLGHQLDRVKQELTDNLAREPIIQEQMTSLHWQLEQKSREVEALAGQRSSSEQRQGMEIEDLHKTVQNQQTELDNLRQELAVARQDRSVSQTEMSQLRATLKASVQHHKLTRKLNENTGEADDGGGMRDTGTQVESRDLPMIPPLPFDLDLVEKLLQDSTVKALESKPLDNLQTCLSSLRSEITGLQKQMDDHINTVETSTQSWSSVENQVMELRRIVKTINGTSVMTNGQGMDSLAGAGVDGVIDI